LTTEELLSEIWQKLLGPVSALDHLEQQSTLMGGSINLDAPECDGRVVWLINEIGGGQGIAHRYEDILRQRFGRSLPGGGRPIVQPGLENEIEEPEADQESVSLLQQADAKLAWLGFIEMAQQQFLPNDDVSSLLQVLAAHADILTSSSRQWPVAD